GTVTVIAEATTDVIATLTLITGSISVSSNPDGANIFLDGGTQTQGITTAILGGISPGTHTIRLTKDGYYDWTGTVTVIAEATTDVIATLTLITGTDTTPPTFNIEACPDPTKAGTVTITVSASEPLVATPRLTMQDTNGGTMAVSFDSLISGTYTYSAVIQENTPDGTVTILVVGTDTAGNQGIGTKTFQVSIPRKVVIVDGDGQFGTVATTLKPFVVRVTDNLDRPIPGHIVHWQIIDSPATATLSMTTTTTGIDGTTSSTLTLGTKSGTYRVTASGSMQATFTATAAPDTADILSEVTGNNQTSTVTAVLTPFVVKVTDTYGNPIAGHLVHWQIIESPATASLSTTTTTTGIDGTTSSILTLGTKSGTYLVTAIGSMQATFTTTATPGTAGILSEVTGNNQTNTVTAELTPFVVKVTDTYGNPIAGHSVHWEIIDSPATATLSTATTTTGINGTTSSILTLGTKSGTYIVTAQGSMQATFTATATPGTLSRIIIENLEGIEIDTYSMTTDGTLSLYCLGYDADNNLIGDIAGTWTVEGGIGTCAPTYGTSTIFYPTTAGTGTISAQHESLTDTTGVITVNAGSLFLVEISATPTTILKGGTFTLTIIPKDKNGNIIASQGTVTLSNRTSSILPTISNIQATTNIIATITLSPNGGWDVITADVTIGANHVSGTCSILVLLPKEQGEIDVVLPWGTATAKGTFTENFWIKIEDKSDAGTLTLLAGQIGIAVEITMGTETGIITGTLPTTIFVEIPFDSSKLGTIDRSTLKLWIYRDGGWHEIEDSGVYPARDYIWGNITHLTLLGISGKLLFAPNLTNVFAYPNPCRVYKGNKITFKKLTAQANIKIFNIVGELVKEIEHTNGTDAEVWTNPGEVASGVYIYLITNDMGQKIIGKLGIIK
ncbi:MAG: PEGA domain-containing protein, partial [Nitrospirota bacterium]